MHGKCGQQQNSCRGGVMGDGFALALSGGSLRGPAHVGVVQAMLARGFEPSVVAGTSVGSIVAALLGRGVAPAAMESAVGRARGADIVELAFPVLRMLKFAALLPFYRMRPVNRMSDRVPSGLFSGDRLERYLTRLVMMPVSRTAIPFLVVTTDLCSGDAVVFYQGIPQPAPFPRTVWLPMPGNPAVALRASCSLPGIFSPLRYGDRLLVDGSLRNNLPVDLLHHVGWNRIVAVDLHKTQMNDEFAPGFLRTLDRMLDIMLDELMDMRTERIPVCVIRPEIDRVGWTAWGSLLDSLRIGRETAFRQMGDIERYLAGGGTGREGG